MSAIGLINSIPDIENKSYLELGIFQGSCFNTVISKNKVSVDKDFNPMYKMTTDEFFNTVGANMFFDVIYIDACHEYEYVLRDYNNSIKHLNSNGYLFVHDLIPTSEEWTKPQYCGTGFKMLYYILKYTDFKPFVVEDVNFYGLALFRNCGTVIPNYASINITYGEFMEFLKDIKRIPIDVLRVAIVKGEV